MKEGFEKKTEKRILNTSFRLQPPVYISPCQTPTGSIQQNSRVYIVWLPHRISKDKNESFKWEVVLLYK